MEVIKDTVAQVMQGLEVKKRKRRDVTPETWLKRALAKKELKHIKFKYFRKGVLGVYVDSSAWLYNLTLQKEKLLAKLNKQSTVIKDIYLRIGEINPVRNTKALTGKNKISNGVK